MNAVIQHAPPARHNPHSGSDFADFDLPEPPDNFDEWNSLPEDFRERVTNTFTAGIDREYDLIRTRVATEYATARIRQQERDARRAQDPRRGFR